MLFFKCSLFQKSHVTGYAANNSRALERRRSSDALYVMMCLDKGNNKCHESDSEFLDFSDDFASSVKPERWRENSPNLENSPRRENSPVSNSPASSMVCLSGMSNITPHQFNRYPPFHVNSILTPRFEASEIKDEGGDYLPMNIGRKFNQSYSQPSSSKA